MNQKTSIIITILIVLILLVTGIYLATRTGTTQETPELNPQQEVEIIVFWGQECPACKTHIQRMEEINQHPLIHIQFLEVYHNQTNQAKWLEHGTPYVPLTIINNQKIVGLQHNRIIKTINNT